MVILAIGGSANTGKTTLAATIAQRLNLDCVVHVDDLRAKVDDSSGGNFVDITPDVWKRAPTWLCHALVTSTRKLHPAITNEINELVHGESDGVIEGEGVEPALSRAWPRTLVRPVYVIETDAGRLRETFAQRASGAEFLALTSTEQHAIVEMNRLYGAWLRREAERHRQPWVPSQPWSTLPDRVLAAVARA